MKYLTLFVLILLGACSGAHLDLNEGDGGSDAISSSDASGSRDASTVEVSLTSCQARCGAFLKAASCQCDSECVQAGDCCGDYVKQCLTESKPAADASDAGSNEVVPQNTCKDNDGDGYCDASPKPGDCNDNDKAINPGAVEKCKDDGTGNGVDENCNGQVDEGCKTPSSNPVPTSNSLTVTYPDSGYRRLSYGITSDTSFNDWKPQAWTMNPTLTVDLGQPEQNNCFYLRFNVDQPQGWLCMGNTTLELNTKATITANLFGKTYNTSDVKKVAKDGGCSAYILVAKPGASCQIP